VDDYGKGVGMSDNPKHRRDGVPLDGAPDLGLYTTPPPTASEPVTTSTWSSHPAEYAAPSPLPPEYPGAPTVSEYQSAAAAELAAPIDQAPHDETLEQFGDDPDAELTG
jgi:hypothetical protein